MDFGCVVVTTQREFFDETLYLNGVLDSIANSSGNSKIIKNLERAVAKVKPVVDIINEVYMHIKHDTQ